MSCGSDREYAQSYDSELTAAKHDIMVNGYDGRMDAADDSSTTIDAQGELAVRYMGVDAKGDPILQVLSPDLKRTDVIVEQAETDRVHLGAFGVREVTVIVVDATDDLLTYRLKRDWR